MIKNLIYGNKCWTCGEEYENNKINWKQCNKCKVWNCSECLPGCWFYEYGCANCNITYCNMCEIENEGFCPSCNKVADLIYAYGNNSEHKEIIRINGYWYYRNEVRDWIIELEKAINSKKDLN